MAAVAGILVITLGMTGPLQGTSAQEPPQPGDTASDAASAPASSEDDTGSCHPFGTATCGLPWPSDTHAINDPTSETGVRLDVPEDLIAPELREQLPSAVQPANLFRDATGFSASGPVVFEVDGPIDRGALPADGGDIIRVFDLDTGEAVPVLAEVDPMAARRTTPGHVVRVWPRTRFAFGHEHLAVLTTRLQPRDGGSYEPAPGIVTALTDPDSDRAAYVDRFVSLLSRHGVDSSEILTLTAFTVRGEQDMTGPLLAMARRVAAEEHPVRNLRVLPWFAAPFGGFVAGKVRTTDLRRADDGGFPRDPDAPGKNRWLDFLMTLPSSSRYEAAPVTVYGHGLTATKETFFGSALTNARKGIATIAIDQPNHGSRSAIDGGNIQYLASPQNVTRMAAILPQSALDMVSVVRAVETSLSELDVLPVRFQWFRGLVFGDGRPELDPNRILYAGTSMGGVLGAAFLGVAPRVDAALLQVPGVGVMNILGNSIVYDSLNLDNVVPRGATGAEAALMFATVQHLIDPGDASNYVHLVRAPVNAPRPIPTFMVYGWGDPIVPNPSSERLAALAGLPLVGPEVYPIPWLPRREAPDPPGWGAMQIDAGVDPDASPESRSDAHMAFAEPAAVRATDAWLDMILQHWAEGS